MPPFGVAARPLGSKRAPASDPPSDASATALERGGRPTSVPFLIKGGQRASGGQEVSRVLRTRRPGPASPVGSWGQRVAQRGLCFPAPRHPQQPGAGRTHAQLYELSWPPQICPCLQRQVCLHSCRVGQGPQACSGPGPGRCARLVIHCGCCPALWPGPGRQVEAAVAAPASRVSAPCGLAQPGGSGRFPRVILGPWLQGPHGAGRAMGPADVSTDL